MYVSQFRSVPPAYRVAQTDGLRWLAAAQARAARAAKDDIHEDDIHEETLLKLLQRFGCGQRQLEWRGTFLKDFTHLDWARMRIFGGQAGLEERRQAFFNEVLLEAVAPLYLCGPAVPFANWIHVTCTGYSSPSLAQVIASRNGWGEKVEILHAYHMGCYAALPALRMARGNLDAEILHTELCTLHLDPCRRAPEQLVVQSLFADGVIAYRVTSRRPELGFEVDEVSERIVPETLGHMSWDVASTGFRMRLAREVPQLVREAVVRCAREWRAPNTVYAIHPGGPKIIDGIQEALGLSEEQVFFSREVLREHGNMSSATLPHVWEKMLPLLPEGTPVVSLGFGPGLTVAAARMRKVGTMK